MTQDLFDRAKFREIIGDLICPCLTPDTCSKRESARDFIQAECQRNRIEAVKEALERLKVEELTKMHIGPLFNAGWNQCATNTNIEIAMELSKLQTKEGGK